MQRFHNKINNLFKLKTYFMFAFLFTSKRNAVQQFINWKYFSNKGEEIFKVTPQYEKLIFSKTFPNYFSRFYHVLQLWWLLCINPKSLSYWRGKLSLIFNWKYSKRAHEMSKRMLLKIYSPFQKRLIQIKHKT